MHLFGPWAGRVCSVAVDRPLSKLLSCSGHAVLLHKHLVLLLLLLQHEVCKLLLLLAVLFSSHAVCPRCILHSAIHDLRLEPVSSRTHITLLTLSTLSHFLCQMCGYKQHLADLFVREETGRHKANYRHSAEAKLTAAAAIAAAIC